jgi:hypothetical protein
MKRLLSVLIVVAISTSIFGQANGAAQIKFAKSTHDFGQFKEEDGPQAYSFEFVNNGTTDLLITRVIASCGCTTPTWTNSPVKPGGKGYVEATYDPANRPNKFKKTVTVYTNGTPAVTVLIIEGDVIPKELSVEDIYRWPIGDIRFKSNHLAFTDVLKGEKKIRVMEVINTSDKSVKLGFDRVPAHLEMVAKPEMLKPGEKGIIEGRYDGSKMDDWGYVNDLVRIVLNDEVVNNVYMVVSANLTEDFKSLSKEQLANAPIAEFESTKFDFGSIKQQQSADVKFSFVNKGKSDLIIRKVRSSCGCTTVTPSNLVIKPGQKSSIDARFDAGVRKGKQHKVITVITNDPKNSQIILVVSGDVIEPGK